MTVNTHFDEGVKIMKSQSGVLRFVDVLASMALIAFLAAGCATTTHESPNIIQRVQGETAAGPPPNGFLGSDYSLLHPPVEGSDQKAELAFISQNGNFASYNKIMIAPC